MTGELSSGTVSVIGEAVTGTGNTVSIAIKSLPDFAPTLEYLVEQITVLVQNPHIVLVIGVISGIIIDKLPEKHRGRGPLIATVIAIGLVGLISLAGEIKSNIRTVILLGLILGPLTSKGYDYLKKEFGFGKVNLPPEGQV